MQVKIKRIHGNKNPIPKYQTEGSAGFDLTACIDNNRIICAGDTEIIPTGFIFEIPNGYEMQIRPRSGLAAKFGITVLNSPGTIDSDYRGEVKVILTNLSNCYFEIKNGDRIAQGVICPVIQAELIEVDELTKTEREQGGFGSTGV